ncbi:MAG: TlpA disulfide reductase family protein [Pirellulales bacterium]
MFRAPVERTTSAFRVAAAFVVALWIAAPLVAQNADSAAPATLRWKNGDELPGTLVGATGERLTWQSPVLTQPISVDLNYLESVKAAKPATAAAAGGPHRFALANGDMVDGELVGISNTHFHVKSPRHGQMSIIRSWVTSVSRADRAELADLTRTGAARWQSLDRQWNVQGGELAGWKKDEPGQVSTNVAGARLFLPVNLPAVCEIELALRWQSTPAFTFAYGSLAALKRRSGDLQVDTWADELVVQTIARPDDFQHLGTLNPKSKFLRLRLLWNRETGQLAVYDGSFNLLAMIAGARDQSPRAGLFLENRGAELTVNVLRVGFWDGKQRPNEAASQDRISTLDGLELYGKIAGMDADGLMQVDTTEGERQRIPIARVAAIEIRGIPATKMPEDAPDTSNLRYHDGTRLHGQLLEIRGGIASFRTAFSDEPVKGSLGGLRELTLPNVPSTSLPAAPFVLAMGSHQLRGTLTGAGNSLGWQPAGSSDVIPLAADGRARITRVEPATKTPDDAKQDDLSKYLDSVYLINGDRIPCNVLAIDDVALRLAPGVGEARSIPRDQVKAIELNTKVSGPVSSFNDARWQLVARQPNAIEQADRRILIRGRADVNHPELMKDGGFEFDVEWNRNVQATLNVYLFTVGITRVATAPRVQIVSQGGQVQLVVISNGNAQASVLALGQNGKDQTRFGFFLENSELKISVDGNQVLSTPLPDRRPAGRGVSISCTTTSAALNVMNRPNAQPVMNANVGWDAAVPANPQAAGGQAKKDYLMALSNARSGGAAGAVRGMALADQDRKQFLLVPRSRQNNPPQHALIAQNGDLLRGELIEMGTSVIQFRSVMEDFNLPRERMAAIVWLAIEGAEKPKAPPAGLSQAVFRNGSIISLAVEKAVDNELIGRHPLLGTCRLALDAIRELRLGPQDDANQLLAYSEWTLINAKDPVIPGVAGGAGGDQEFGTFSPLVGKQAEDFTLRMLDGKTFRLSEHKDKVVVLDFWATWCNPCVRSLPELLDATSGFDAKDVLFVGVNEQETAPTIKAFLDSHSWKFAVALDADGKIGKQYQVDGIPQTFVIGRGGKIERVNLGYNPNVGPALKSAIEGLVKGENAKPAGEQPADGQDADK